MEAGPSKEPCIFCNFSHGPGTCPYITPEKSGADSQTISLKPAKTKKEFQCMECNKKLSTKGKLTLHMTLHTGDRRYSCEHCKKGFDSKFKLVRHMVVHSHSREWVCSACGTSFRRKDHLEAHTKHHCADRTTYPCDLCDKRYSCTGSLRKHRAVHSAQSGNLKCQLCPHIADNKDGILQHIKTHSGSRFSKSGGDKKYRCGDCDRSFFTKKDARRHSVVHTRSRDFLCEFCPRAFGRSDHLTRHIEKTHTSAQPNPESEETPSLGQEISANPTVLPGFSEAFRDV